MIMSNYCLHLVNYRVKLTFLFFNGMKRVKKSWNCGIYMIFKTGFSFIKIFIFSKY